MKASRRVRYDIFGVLFSPSDSREGFDYDSTGSPALRSHFSQSNTAYDAQTGDFVVIPLLFFDADGIDLWGWEGHSIYIAVLRTVVDLVDFAMCSG